MSEMSSQNGLQTCSQLPPEIMYQIYFNLSPVDYNSARHTCRSWYISSLERSLLEVMLNRGGWSSGIGIGIGINNEWLMSKYIARECALGPDWTGNGLSLSKETQTGDFLKSDAKKTPFVHISTIDFTESGIYHPGTNEPNVGMLSTVSNCGDFLMMAHGCVVYIYQLDRSYNDDEDGNEGESGSLKPITSVICPRRVLACSMDTSSRRYAIAVLLENRMGLVCDLTGIRDCQRRSSAKKSKRAEETPRDRDCVYRNGVSTKSLKLQDPCRAQTKQHFVFPTIMAEASSFNFGVHPSLESQKDVAYSDSLNPRCHDLNLNDSLIYQGGPLNSSFSTHQSWMPIESSYPTLYAPLCSADDPPRSVAICPQRRCVAFGCSSGIELHWVDALTAQDLSRWFPLTAPSDYLYFLPPRFGVDSAKKLRLISSAGRPGERPVIADRFGAVRTSLGKRYRTRSNPSWGISSGQYIANGDNSDHYHAVPLSDGYHILFTDPATGVLCLGSDAPVGGPTKLLRKIWFTGPQNEGTPIAYCAANELKNGIRVVAAYGQGSEQSIWLFSIPFDVFFGIHAERSGGKMSAGSVAQNGCHEWVKWWYNARTFEPSSPEAAVQGTRLEEDKLWPVQVRGQQIGKICGLVDLTVNARMMTIWAFSSDGVAKTWQFDDGSLNGIRKKFTVMRDGSIWKGSLGGDGEMVGMTYESSGHESFDGSTSMTNSRVLVLGGQHYLDYQATSDRLGGEHDADGDILMANLPGSEIDVSDYESDGSFETITLAHSTHEDVYHHEYLAGRSFVEQLASEGQDWVHLMIGIARIDVEIS